MSYASWQNPVFLSELNDYQNGYAASYPNVSEDENLIFFIRSTPTKTDALWEARRNPETGVFDQQRQLSELKYGGAQVYGHWLSPDNLRLYYAASDPAALGWSKRPIWLATRTSINAPWQLVRRCTELEIDNFQTSCSLTADEKVMMWESVSFTGGGQKRIYLSMRPSIRDTFSAFREVTELEDLGAWLPRLSPDGLSVYFRILKSDSIYESWIGYRESLYTRFDKFSPLEEINEAGNVTDICPTWDGRELVYFQRQGEVGDLNTTGIFVSQWVDDPYADAVGALQRAAAKKQQAIELLAEAGADEKTAVQILSSLPKEALPDGLTDKARWEAIRSIYQSLKKQEQVSGFLETCIVNLQTALWLLPTPIR
jgi:hypothetical protein